jgi:selenocysteine-specific elongation factor
LRERVFVHARTEVFRSILGRLEREGVLILEKDFVRARKHSLELSSADAQLRDQLEQVYERAGLEPPSLDAVMERAGKTNADGAHGRKILQLLIDAGSLVRVQGDLFFHRKSLDHLQEKLYEFAAQHEPERSIDVAAFKLLAGVSRKYAIPLLEYLDRQRVTRREGDRRVILKRK